MAYEEGFRSDPDVQQLQRLPIHMDVAELDSLFARCMPKLARTTRRMGRSAQDSEDILQEGLLSAFVNLGQFQGRSKFATWLYSITRNEAKMQARKTSSRWLLSIEGEASDADKIFLEKAFQDARPNPEECCAQKERSGILMSTLRDLPPTYQRAIQLCDIDELCRKDAAAALGVSTAAMKTLLHRARRLASKKIQQVIASNRPRAQAAGQDSRAGRPSSQ